MPGSSPREAADEVSTTLGHPGAARGPHGRLGAADVHVEQPRRVGGAHRVDTGHVVDQPAAGHAGRERVLVESVPADHAGAARKQRLLGRVGAGQRDQLVAELDQPRGQRAPDQTAASGQEDLRHVARSSRVTAGRARTR